MNNDTSVSKTDVLKTGIELILNRLDEALYALSHVKHYSAFAIDYELLSEAYNRTVNKKNYWLVSSTRTLKNQLEKRIDGLNLSIALNLALTPIEMDFVRVAETALCEAWELCLENPPACDCQVMELSRIGKFKMIEAQARDGQ